MFDKLPDILCIGCSIGSNGYIETNGLGIGVFVNEITKPNQAISGFGTGSSVDIYFSIIGNEITWYGNSNRPSVHYNQKDIKYIWCSINKNA